MAGIITNVDSDVQKLRKLKNEIEEVKKALKSINIKVDINIAEGLQSQLKSLTVQYKELVNNIAQAEAKVLLSAKKINDVSQKIIQAQEKMSKTAGIPMQMRSTNSQGANVVETASIQAQAQAKAYEDLKAEINGILGTREANVKSMVDEMNAIRLINAEIKRITKSQGESASLSSAQQRRLEQLNNSLLTHKTALSEVRQTLNNNVKLDNAAATSMNGLSQSLSRMRIAYRELTEEERNSPIGKELLASINQADAKIKQLDATIGNHQRNVGDYTKQWNGLQYQVQMVARELPNFAINPQIGIMSLTNNIPYLVDELKKAKDAHKAYIAEVKAGNKDLKAVPSVGKQVLSSLLNWQTAIVMGITLITAYRKEITDWAGSLFSAKKALSETFQSLEDFQKKVGDISGSVIATLEKLSAGWKRLGNDLDAQKKFILENRDAINSMGVSVTDAAEAERLFNSDKDAFILGILQRAKAVATMELASEQYKKAVQKMMEADAMPDKSSQFIQTSSFGTGYYIETDNLKKKNAQKEAEDMFKSGTELVQKYAQFSEEERKTLESIGIKTTKTIVEGSIEAIEAAIALKQQSLKKVTDPKKYKRIEAEIKAEQAKLKAITGEKEKLRPYVDTYSQAQEVEKSAQAIKDAVRKTELDIRQQGIDLLEEGSEKQLEQIRLNYDKRKDEIEKQERELLQKLQDEERKQWEKDNPDYKKKNLQFTPTITSLTPEQRAQFDKEYSLAYQKQEKDTQALLDKLLEKYRDYDAQRTAIEKQGNEEIAYLQSKRTDANAEEIDRAINVAQDKIKEGIQQINNTQAEAATKDNNFFKLLYGDVSSMSFETLENLISQAKQLREYLSGNGDSKGITFISPDQLKAIEASPAELEKIKKALDKLLDTNQEGNNNKWESIFTSFKKGFAELKGAKGFKEISGAIGTISGAASTAAGELSNMFEEMGKTEIADAIDGMQQVMSAVSNIGQGFAKGGIIGGIGAAIGEAANFIGQAFAASARHKAALKEIMSDTIAQQREYNLLLLEQNLLYEKASTIFGVDSYAKAKNAVDNLKESIEDLNDELIGSLDQQKRQSKNTLFKKFFGVSDPQAELKKAYAGLADIQIKTGHKKTGLFGWGKGKDIYSSILDVYPQLIDESGKFDKELAQTIISTREMSDESKSALQNMIDLAEQAKDAYEELNDYLTDIFGDLGDSMTDALVDAFTNGKDAAKAFADSVSDMLENLAKQMVYSVTLAPLMEKAQKEMLDTMQNTGLTDEQKFNKWTGVLNNLVDDAINQQSLANKLLEEYQQAAADKGFDIFKPESYSQSSTKGGFQIMSQDTGNELNGRFTALQMSGEEIKAQSIKQTDILSSIYGKMSLLDLTNENLTKLSRPNIPDLAGQTKEVIANSYQPQINVVFPTEDIKALADKMSNMERIVDEIRTTQNLGWGNVGEITENVEKIVKSSPEAINTLKDIKKNTNKL